MSRYETETWKTLVTVQNELSGYVPVDILTITGFMKTDEELEEHLRSCQARLEGYKHK